MKEEKFGFVFKFFEYAETHVAVLLLSVPTLAHFWLIQNERGIEPIDYAKNYMICGA